MCHRHAAFSAQLCNADSFNWTGCQAEARANYIVGAALLTQVTPDRVGKN